MAIQNVLLTVTKNTTANSPVSVRCNLAQPYLRAIHVRTMNIYTANIGEVYCRISNQNMIIAPFPGTGLSLWVNPMNGLDWYEFRKLQGPNYEVLVEAYNIDASTDFILQVTFELSTENYLPVNVKDFDSSPVKNPLKQQVEGY